MRRLFLHIDDSDMISRTTTPCKYVNVHLTVSQCCLPEQAMHQLIKLTAYEISGRMLTIASCMLSTTLEYGKLDTCFASLSELGDKSADDLICASEQTAMMLSSKPRPNPSSQTHHLTTSSEDQFMIHLSRTTSNNQMTHLREIQLYHP